ncbi:major facilitator superfamily domain-containing protein 6-like [Temnothorax curvispinosus]|uniref:Major facilitator superfamily domain-containing protein 6-like n=1 Tax=Temnothorax curvispinosus TaxID=300111 RepID=A0A6J1QQ54_9HYME|nr:major facilitator superfamily domain-containing protein 6-like [Temnothorax curvispinosus]
MKINYGHLCIKAHYFFFVASTGVSYPYIPVYGKQIGVSPLVIGIIGTFFSILHLITKPVCGFIMDYSQWKKLIFIVLVALSSCSYVSIFFLPSLPGPMLLDQHFQNISYASLSTCDMENHALAIASCNGTKDTTCRWICNNMRSSMGLSFYPDQQRAIISPDTACLLNINETSLSQKNVTNNYNCNVTCDNFEDQCVYASNTFWSFVFLWSLAETSYFTSMSISDAMCFHILGQGKQSKFGKQRLWATMGYGVAACLSGYMMDLWSPNGIYQNYTPMLILALVFICVNLICCIKLEMPLEKGSTTILKDVFILLKSKSIVIFLCFVAFAGILNAIKRNYLFWYLEDLAIATGYMNKIKLIEGLIIIAETFGGEIAFLFFSGKIIKKLGYSYTIIFCFICYAIRWGLISLSPTPWWIIPIELIMHGSSYALCIAAISAYANVVTPPGTSVTVQGLVQGMHDSFGFSVGNFIIGVSYKTFGGTITMRIFSAFATLSALTYFIFSVLCLKHETPGLRNNVEWKNPDDARKHCVIAETFF